MNSDEFVMKMVKKRTFIWCGKNKKLSLHSQKRKGYLLNKETISICYLLHG